MARNEKRSSRKVPYRKSSPSQTPTASARPRQRTGKDTRWRSVTWVVGGVILGMLVAFWMWNTNRADGQVAVPISVIDAPDYHALLIDAETPDRVLFGSHAGIQESEDGGLTWSPGTLSGMDAMILASSPADPDTIYAAGHDVFQVSSDGGATWEEVTHDLPGMDVHGFAQHPDDPHRLYAFIVGFGGWTSSDAGATWQSFGSQPPGSGSWLVLASNGDTLYAATDAGISRSNDQGSTWRLLEAQPGKMTFFSLAVSPADPEVIYAGTPVGVVRSTDGGTSWTTIPSPNVMAVGVTVSPDDPNRLMVVDDMGQVFRSSDGGESWESPPDGDR